MKSSYLKLYFSSTQVLTGVDPLYFLKN